MRCSRPSAEKVDISDDEILAEYRTQRYQPFMVLENLTPYQVGKIQSAGLEAKGFGFQTAPLRHYPRGTELAHVIGYLSRDQQRNRGKYLAGDVIYDRYKGASGLEQVFNQDLSGKDGNFMISTTPEGYARSAVMTAPATYGNNVRLAIDSKVQAAMETAMAASPNPMKAAVMIDVHTGDVVAHGFAADLRPEHLRPLDQRRRMAGAQQRRIHSPARPPASTRTYPPGSGFKTVTSIAAMKAGVFDPNWVVVCTGSLRPRQHAHGP